MFFQFSNMCFLNWSQIYIICKLLDIVSCSTAIGRRRDVGLLISIAFCLMVTILQWYAYLILLFYCLVCFSQFHCIYCLVNMPNVYVIIVGAWQRGSRITTCISLIDWKYHLASQHLILHFFLINDYQFANHIVFKI